MGRMVKCFESDLNGQCSAQKSGTFYADVVRSTFEEATSALYGSKMGALARMIVPAQCRNPFDETAYSDKLQKPAG